jgi:TubC N-terminal docking domain
MTDALDLVERLRARGVALERDGHALVIRPADAVSPEEVAALRCHKAEVLQLLTVPSGYAHPWPDALPGLGPRTIGCFDCCSRCERWSWARYGRTVLCLACAKALRP